MKYVWFLVFINACSLWMDVAHLQQFPQEWPPGWTEKCIGCICEATSACNETVGCLGEFCGMFLISRLYWTDAGSPVLLGDDKNNPEGIAQSCFDRHHVYAFVRCAVDSYCASRAVNQYIQKFIQDCNNDGSLSCDDYSRLHFFGYVRCDRSITRTPYYRAFQKCWLKI